MRLFAGVLWFVMTFYSLKLGAEPCDQLLSKLTEIEVVAMQNAVMTGRIALARDSVKSFEEILGFVSRRYEEEALAGVPLLLSHLLMRTDLSKKHFVDLLNWIQRAEVHFLVDQDQHRSLDRIDRFFEVLTNVNRPREILGVAFSRRVLNLIDEHPFGIGGEDIRIWLGDRYVHWKRELLGFEKPVEDVWEHLKNDLIHSMDPQELLFARYFLTQFFLNLELLGDSQMWSMSCFSVLPEPDEVGDLELAPLDEDEPAPMLFDEDTFDEFEDALAQLMEEMESGQDPSDEFLMSQIETMTTLVHLLARDDDDQDESQEFRAHLAGAWDLSPESLLMPVLIDDQEDRWITPLQATVYWDRPQEREILVEAIRSARLPYWLGVPSYPRSP